MDARAAREELWRRYDAGDLDAKALEARLRSVDRAGDEASLRQALDAPLTTTDPKRRMFLVGGVVVLLVLAIAVPLLVLGDDADDALATTSTTGGDVPVTPPGPTILPVPEPLPDCPELADAVANTEAAGIDGTPNNPALLSEPPALPEGYRLDDDEDVAPGTDPDIAMQINAGTPLPVEIRARTLSGDLDVNLRTFRYASRDEAIAAGRSVIGQGVCNYGAEGFTVPDRPELVGSVVSGPIPTTAFVGFRIGDRRFTVSVVADFDPETGQATDEMLEAAKALAGTIAGLELDAARTAPPPG